MPRRAPRGMQIAGALAAAGGAALFVWSLRHAGTSAVMAGVQRVGAGIVVVLFLGGLRGFVRATAWRLCLAPAQRVGIGSMFATYLAGDALGNVTPFGFLISEPSKIVMLRRDVDVSASIAALTVENLFYSATVIVVLAAGTLLLFATAAPHAVRVASVAMLGVSIAAAVAAAWIAATRQRVVSGTVEWLIRRNIAPSYLEARLPQIRRTGDLIFGFMDSRARTVLPVMLLEVSYHAAAVAEIWFALALITGVRPAVVTAFVLEYVNRTITIAFQFVPMWLGVDEAGTSLATDVLHLGPAAGVSLALVRKTRVVVWTAIGIVLLVTRASRDSRASITAARPR